MGTLADEHCVACRSDAPRLSDDELAQLRAQIPDWSVIERDGVPQLERVFNVRDFKAALDLANKIGTLAEEEGHHPALLVEYSRLTVRWWTHKIKGLHRNDVIMAARTDQLAVK